MEDSIAAESGRTVLSDKFKVLVFDWNRCCSAVRQLNTEGRYESIEYLLRVIQVIRWDGQTARKAYATMLMRMTNTSTAMVHMDSWYPSLNKADLN